MARIGTGSIEYEVSVPTTIEKLARAARAFGCEPNDERNSYLFRLAHRWTEHAAMARPDLTAVMKILNRAIKLCTFEKRSLFARLMRKLAAARDATSPAEAYVYETILSELRIACGAEWRDNVAAGNVDFQRIEKTLKDFRKRLRSTYHNCRGNHEIGTVIEGFISVLESAGKPVTAGSRMPSRGHRRVGEWIVDNAFVRAGNAFIRLAGAKAASRIDFGHFLHRALPKIRLLSSQKKKIAHWDRVGGL